MIAGFLRERIEVAAPAGVSIVQGTFFTGLAARKTTTAFVVHESVTRSAATTFAVLKRRKLSVHLIGDEFGGVVQHADLDRRAQHAGARRNPISVGYELVNPYYPRLLPKRDGPWTAVLAAPWAHEKRYVVPTLAQAEALARTIAWATSIESALGIPRVWPALRDGRFTMGRVTPAPMRGVFAHHTFGHSDGSWPSLYAWMRLEAGLDPNTAYAEAQRRAIGTRKVDLRDLLPTTSVA